jgi:hypothetical protein
MTNFVLITYFVFFSSSGYAACTGPNAPNFTMRYNVTGAVGDFNVCGTFGWYSVQVADTAVSCAIPGQFRYNSSTSPDRFEFCAGDSSIPSYTWRDATGASLASACSQNGAIERGIIAGELKVCVESDWKKVGP